MKFKFISICLSIMVILAPIQTYAGDTSNLEGAWLLDEASGTRFDETANNNDLTDNNTVLQNASCQFDECADFEAATSEYLSLADNDSFDFGTGDFTIGMWINFESQSGENTLYSKGNSAADNGTMNIYILSPNAALRIFTQSLFSWTPSNATWYHVAFTRESDTTKFILNGVQQGSSGTLAKNVSSAEEIWFGRRNGAAGQFDGLMDESFVFSRALSAAEIDDIGDNGLTAFISGAPRRRVILFLAFALTGMTAHYTGQAHRINEHRLKFDVERPHWMHLFDAIVNFKWIPSAHAAEDFGSVNQEVDSRYTQVVRNKNRQVDVYDGPQGTGYIITLYKIIGEDEYLIQKHTGPEQRRLKIEWTKIEEEEKI